MWSSNRKEALVSKRDKDTCEYVVGFADGAQKRCGKEAEHWLPSVMQKAPVPICDHHAQFTLRPVSEWGDIQ